MKLKPLALLLSAAFATLAAQASPSGIVISQVYGGGGNAGATWQNDFIELFNAGSAAKDISGWSVQYSSATGTSWANQKVVIPAGTTLAAGQYYLVKLASTAAVGGVVNGDTTNTGINMSGASGKVALVASSDSLPAVTAPTGVEDILSYGSATPTEGSPTPALTNTTAAIRGGAGCTDTGSNSADFATATPTPRNTASALHLCGAPVNAPIVTACAAQTVVAGTASNFSVTASDADSRVNAASATGTWPAGITLGSFSAAGADGATATQQVAVAASVAAGSYSLNLGWANDDAQSAACTISLSVQGATTIPQIQGNGAQSPLKGQVVTTSGIVTLVLNNGFYLQDPAGDNDPSTSDGIFVFTSTAPSGVAVGDSLRLSATVSEYSVSTSAASLAAPLTELTAPTGITVLSHGNALPQPQVISLVDEQGHLERFEGMLVTLSRPLTVQQNYFLGRYGQLTLAEGERVLTPTNVFRPGSDALTLQSANMARSILLDDNSSLQNPNPTPYIGADNTVRAGDTVAPITGVIDFGPATSDTSGLLLYKIMPTVAPVITRTNARTTAPDPVGGNVRVASANVLNYFTTFTDGTTASGQAGQGCSLGGAVSAANCRGADNAAEFARQRAKLVAEIGAMDADVVGLMEMQNNGNTAVQNLVDGLNAAVGAGRYAAV
ncbi:lamin tail domain-containing protein, partial [Pelomonas sp. KK5]|uniref:lamin tail domain-containing protein n=1 Tax=Pelomonas sp. KK5 TaxID=1855730 RepID=UPI0018E953B4